MNYTEKCLKSANSPVRSESTDSYKTVETTLEHYFTTLDNYTQSLNEILSKIDSKLQNVAMPLVEADPTELSGPENRNSVNLFYWFDEAIKKMDNTLKHANKVYDKIGDI